MSCCEALTDVDHPFEVILFEARSVGQQYVVVGRVGERGCLRGGQGDLDGAGGAVDVGDSEVGVLGGAPLVPYLGGD